MASSNFKLATTPKIRKCIMKFPKYELTFYSQNVPQIVGPNGSGFDPLCQVQTINKLN
jgi:hypothetical protein